MPSVLGVNVLASSYAEVVRKCTEWAQKAESRTVLFVNVHVIMEARDNPKLLEQVNRADMANPDGVPVVWTLQAFGARNATRVYGPDATVALLKSAQESKIPIGFYGGTESTLAKLIGEVQSQYPGINIAFKMSPPFRKFSEDEEEAIVRQITASGVRWLFVGLGCPKQEKWVCEHKDRIPAVLLAVGAAFDFIAGTKPQAPRWMMRNGLEWAFRLASEPRRLAGRYLKTNPRYMFLVAYQWLRRNNGRMTAKAS
ncbi:MAG TPA: WecB/TagA/CpsF family glycosyltransferase [Terracidiphilus sp.]|jgi:N-acetylglucosaminyldiphosphoundecaprenol N-acetyl-beta-D-mannosaminyltransferase